MPSARAASVTPSLRFRVVAWIVISLGRIMRWRITTDGLEHVPRTGGAVITWNHHSHVDYLYTAWGIYRRLDRPVRFLAKRELWDSPVFGWVPRFADAVPVDRGSARGRGRALDTAARVLRRGDLIMVAPEGTISESFELLPFQTGAVRMAQAAGVPIIPSVSWGTHRLVTTGHDLRVRRAFGVPVAVRFGEPIHIAANEDPREATERVRTVMAAMLEEMQRNYPDGTPAGEWWVPARLGGGAPTHEQILAERGVRARRPRAARDLTPPPPPHPDDPTSPEDTPRAQAS